MDQVQYHLPTIQQFAREWPWVDLTDYNVASAPGYHLILAWFYRQLGESLLVLQVLNAVIAAGCVLVFMRLCDRPACRTAWLGLGLLLSPYFHYSAIWLRPDNAGWLTVLGCLWLVGRHRPTEWWIIGGGILLIVVVVVRQSHIWCAAVLWVWAYLGEGESIRPDRNRLTRLGMMILLSLPAFGLLGAFIWMWGGLVPPRFQTPHGAIIPHHSGWKHEGPNWAVPMFILALLGGVMVLALPGMWKFLKKKRQVWVRLCWIMLIWLPVAAFPRSDWNEAEGRYSGLWNFAKKFAVVEERSVLLVPLSVLGAGLVGWVLMSLPRRWGILWGVTLFSFILAQTANAMAWQKYYEPFAVMLVVLGVCWLVGEEAGGLSSRRTASESDAR